MTATAVLVGPVAALKGAALARAARAQHSFLIGVDGGVERLLEAGLRPDLAIGDWDSLRRRSSLRGLSVATLAHAKDRSDLAFAVDAALGAGFRDLICWGVTGHRPDHHLATLYELSCAAARKGIRGVRALGEEGEYVFLAASGARRWIGAGLQKGRIVSVLPIGGEAGGVTLRGFRYPLVNRKLALSSLGLSNETLASRCTVELRRGRVVVMIPEVG